MNRIQVQIKIKRFDKQESEESELGAYANYKGAEGNRSDHNDDDNHGHDDDDDQYYSPDDYNARYDWLSK